MYIHDKDGLATTATFGGTNLGGKANSGAITITKTGTGANADHLMVKYREHKPSIFKQLYIIINLTDSNNNVKSNTFGGDTYVYSLLNMLVLLGTIIVCKLYADA